MVIVQRVKKLGLPLDKLVVIGSGLLDAIGVRPTDDIDLAVSTDLFEELQSTDGWQLEEAYGSKRLVKDDVEVWPGWEDGRGRILYSQLLDDTVEIDGVRFVSLEYLRAWKQWRRRDKDLEDMRLIDNYMSTDDA